MNEKDLETFVNVAQVGSFSQAAQMLGRPQPALSRRVKDLENELDTKLLYRNGRGVELTQAGELLLPRARDILEQMAEARLHALGSARTAPQRMTIGLPPSVARLLWTGFSQHCRSHFDGVQVVLVEALTGHLTEWLAAGRLDAAIVYRTDAVSRLNPDPIDPEPLLLVEHAGTRRAEGPVGTEALIATPLILPSRQHGLRQQVEAWAARHRFKLCVEMEVDSFQSTLQLVSEGAGATLLPRSALRADPLGSTLRLFELEDRTIRRALAAVAASNRDATAQSAAVVRALRLFVQNNTQAASA